MRIRQFLNQPSDRKSTNGAFFVGILPVDGHWNESRVYSHTPKSLYTPFSRIKKNASFFSEKALFKRDFFPSNLIMPKKTPSFLYDIAGQKPWTLS
jgi:hypothetical protein